MCSTQRAREHVVEEQDGMPSGPTGKRAEPFWKPCLPFERTEHTVKGRA